MSAREDILADIRAAVAAAPEAPTVPRDYPRAAQLVGEQLLDRFVERVEDYRATVTRCTSAEVLGTVARLLDRARAEHVVVPDRLPWRIAGAIPDTGLSATELDEVDAVITAAELGIAETGTIVLTHGPGQGRRMLSLVPDVHVCVVRAGQIVGGVPAAVAALDARGPQTWISGPSATSDIELNRVDGVHGPRTLHVVLVDG